MTEDEKTQLAKKIRRHLNEKCLEVLSDYGIKLGQREIDAVGMAMYHVPLFDFIATIKK